MHRALTGLAFLFLTACGGSGGTLVNPGPPVFTVTNLNDDGSPGCLRSIIDNAPPDSIVVFDTALPAGTITLNSSIELVKSVTIGGLAGDLGRHRISGDNNDRIFRVGFPEVVPHFELRDIILSDGSANEGGAIDGQIESLALYRVLVVGCDGSLGDGPGGVCEFRGATLIAEDCAFNANRARLGGAFTLSDSESRFKRCSFFLNQAVASLGGAVFIRGGLTVFDNCSFIDNTAHDLMGTDGRGGAIFARSTNTSECQVSMHSCTLIGNSADNGGGIVADRGDQDCDVSLTLCVLSNSGGAQSDLDPLNGADFTGIYNVVRIGNIGTIFEGFGGNRCGVFPGGLNTMMLADQLGTLGRRFSRPAAGSPAVNIYSGDDLYGLTHHDQRGLPRPVGAGHDAGAIERQ